MCFEEVKKEVITLLKRCMDEVEALDENVNVVYDTYEDCELELDGYEAITHHLDVLCDDTYELIDDPTRRKLVFDQPDDDQFEDEVDEEEFDEEDDIEFHGVHYMDEDDEFDNFLRELDLLNQTIMVMDYDPIANGIVVENVNIEACFGGVKVMGEVVKLDEHDNEAGFVTVNVVFYEADEDDDSIRVLRKEAYDIDLDTVDSYSVFDVEVDLDPDTLDRTSGVNVYLSR